MAKKSNKGSKKGQKAAPAPAPVAAAPVEAKTQAAAPAAASPTLFVLEGSPNSHGVMCLIAENKLQYTIKPLDATKGETRTPEFVAKNPFHCCPTLEDTSLVVWESHAILRYICNVHKLDQWYPQSSPERRACVEQALDWRHTSFYPAMAKIVYPIMGYGPPVDEKTNAENVVALKVQMGFLESYYLKEGKFMSGFDTPTIADLSMTCLVMLGAIPGLTVPAKIQEYIARFKAAVSSYGAISASVHARVATLNAVKPAAEAKGKAKAKPAKAAPAASKKKGSKKKAEKGAAPAASGGLDDKTSKACIKEGGKKGQDLGGMSVFGCHYFLTTFIEPQGEMKYLELCMEGANKEVDPEAEDRKGGAGDIAKVFFSAGDHNLAMICHVPVNCTEITPQEYFAACLTRVPAGTPHTVEVMSPTMLKCEIKANADKGVYCLKLRDECIAAGFEFLRKKGLILDDDEEEVNYAEAAGVNLNAGPDDEDY